MFDLCFANTESYILVNEGYDAAMAYISKKNQPRPGKKSSKACKSYEPYEEMKKWLVSKYGRKAGTFLANRMAKAIRKTGKHQCMDNFRVARLWHPFEFGEYAAQKKLGCCGFYDEEVYFVHKFMGIPYWVTPFVFGYNYGH
jgi:hypothetical protein